MCDRRGLDKLREQRDDAIGRAVAGQAYNRLWLVVEEENRTLRETLAATLDELAQTCALLADLTGQ